jgi:hypothetical protein
LDWSAGADPLKHFSNSLLKQQILLTATRDLNPGLMQDRPIIGWVPSADALPLVVAGAFRCVYPAEPATRALLVVAECARNELP